MGKSAQVPLHVWLPDSMEGPTPISALIHAATMVTAGIFMVARMSPLFEYSEAALSFVLVIGATTAFFMGLLGVVNNDIKRVIAYSTLSQLGYMTVALGVSAYSAAIFHLMTHAFFKALLFLAAGLGDHRHASRAGHAEDGRVGEVHADHGDHVLDRLAGADRYAVLLGFLFEGRDHRSGRRVASLGRDVRVLVRAGRRVRHGAVHVPNAVHDVPRARSGSGIPSKCTPRRTTTVGHEEAGSHDARRSSRMAR